MLPALYLSSCTSSPSTAAPASTSITPRLNHSSASAASRAITAAGHSKVPDQPCGQSTCQAKNRARLTITPTTAAVMPVSGAVNFSSLWVDSTSGPPAKDEQERRQEGKPGDQRRRQRATDKGRLGAEYRLHIGTDEADKRHHHDQRPRRGFPQRQTINHLRRRQPAVMPHCALIDVRQHRIGAAEGEQRRLGEEPGHLRQRALPAEQRAQHSHRQQPEQSADQQQDHQTRQTKARMSGRRRVVVDQCRAIVALLRHMPAADGEMLRRQTPADKAGQCRAKHDQRERHFKGEDGDKGRRRNRPQPVVLQHPRADALRRLQDDGRHRRFDAVEQSGHQRLLAIGDVQPGQSDQDEQRRQHEQHPGDDATPVAVQQPADIDRQLLGLGAGQHHAVVQCMQEAPLGNPAPPLDQLLVHDRDLPGRPAKADEAQLEPEVKGRDKTDPRGDGRGAIAHGARARK